MEYRYRIGEMKDEYLRTDEKGQKYIDPSDDKEYLSDEDFGEFAKFIDTRLNGYENYNINRFYGKIWIIQREPLLKVIEEYNSLQRNSDMPTSQVFTNIENKQLGDLLYLMWIDWS